MEVEENQNLIEEFFEPTIRNTGIVIAIYLALLTTLAMFGLFSKTVVIVLLFPVIFLFLFWLYKYLRKLETPWRIQKFDFIALLLILFIAIALGAFHHHLPMGRDDMAYMASAVNISDNGSLEFEDVYSYPFSPWQEISDNTFTSQFVPVYAVGLASFYVLFGLTGIYWFNAVLIFLTLLFLFRLIVLLTKSRHSGITLILLFSSLFTTIWFVRRTNSEILFMFLFWLGIYLFVLGFKNSKINQTLLGFIPITLLPLVRFEGVFFIVSYLLVFIYLLLFSNLRHSKTRATKYIYLPLILNLGIFVWYVVLYSSGYISRILNEYFGTLTSYLLNNWIFLIILLLLVVGIIIYRVFYFTKKEISKISFSRLFFTLLILIGIAWGIYEYFLLQYADTVSWGQIKSYYIAYSFFTYGFVWYIIIALFGWYKKYFKKSVWLIVLISLPSFMFLIEPGIAIDHPWYMRRFIAVLIPLLIILATITLAKLRLPLKQLLSLTLILLALNITISLPILIYRDHLGVDQELSDFAEHFKDNDLLIMQPGWDWQQWAYGLHYLHDLDVVPREDNLAKDKLNEIINSHEHIYLISTSEDYRHPLFPGPYAEPDFKWLLHYPEMQKAADMNLYIDDKGANMKTSAIKAYLDELPPRVIMEKQTLWYITKVK
ncbi:MAG: hypothetical protein ABIE68_03890 [bacterium]